MNSSLLVLSIPPILCCIDYSDNDFVTQNGFINFGETTFKDKSGLDFTLQSLVFLTELKD